MATASIEVSGPDAGGLAGELQAALAAAIQPGDSVSPVEVERSAGLAIVIIGLVFSGAGTARTIWDWWHGRRSEGVKVKDPAGRWYPGRSVRRGPKAAGDRSRSANDAGD